MNLQECFVGRDLAFRILCCLDHPCWGVCLDRIVVKICHSTQVRVIQRIFCIAVDRKDRNLLQNLNLVKITTYVQKKKKTLNNF